MAEYDPSYDGLMVFRLDMARLLPGDIILTRNRKPNSNKERKISSIIATAGRSNFSHAILCVELPTAIEAIGDGVSTLSIGNSFYHSKADVRVLRYRDAKVARIAAAKAGLFIGKGYSVRMAIRSVLPGNAQPSNTEFETFCSALVAAAFRASGAEEFQTIAPDKITPGDLTRLSFLTDVTDSVSLEILAPKNVEEMSALDGERTLSPMKDQAKTLFTLHAAVVDDIIQFMAQWDLTIPIPTTYFETLKFLTEALQSAIADDDPLKSVYLSGLQAIDQKLASEFAKGNLQRMNANASAKDSETISKLIRESFAKNPDINISDTKAMLVATSKQIASRSWVLEESHRLPGLSLAWDQWCELTQLNINDLKVRETSLEEILDRVGNYTVSAADKANRS